MDIVTFFQAARTSDFWQGRKNFGFVATTYPNTWFTMLFDMLERRQLLAFPKQRIFFDSIEKNSLYATLNQSILGAYSLFWLGDVTEEKESKAGNKVTEFLLAYQGPHTLAYFINASTKIITQHKDDLIQLPHEISCEQVLACAQFFDMTLDTKKTACIKKILGPRGVTSLDKACMMLIYLELISTKYLTDYEQLLASVVQTSPTLTMLSEYFFTKNQSMFFTTWHCIATEYPDIFWVTFWSEQVWKACHVIQFLHEKNFAAAKRMSFRLPYSFINRDWQRTDPALLKQAYSFLYHMDYALKTGSTFCSLDLFYINYFVGKFE